MAEPAQAIDRAQVRRRFERAARTYAAASPLEAEIGTRMLERLDYMRAAPRRILDAGAGPAREAQALLARYPGAALVTLDSAHAMLQAGRRRSWRDWLRRGSRALPVVADFAQLPLAAGGVDLLWSNMALHWAGSQDSVLREFARVLAPGGLLMFSTLGPDTLKELRQAAGAARVHSFMDMHDLGDALVAAGFSAPVMDAEIVTLTYADPDGLISDLRRSGQTSARTDRARGLRGRSFRERLRAALVAQAGDSRISATFEVVYGHAWRGEKRHAQDGRTVIRTDALRHQNR
ncbi:MAG: methyltransferase domain-containing protein [bacterium]